MPVPRIPRTIGRGKPKPNLRSRVAHLAFVRQLSCVACGKAAPSEAAHVRTGTHGGAGMKPGDRFAVPLCATCHAKQHRIGELTFWSAPHRSSQRGFAAVDCIARYGGRGAHGVSRATTNRPGEGIWLRDQPGIPAAPGVSAPSGQCAQPNTSRFYHGKMTCPIVTRHDEIDEALSNLDRPRHRHAKQNDAARSR
jgi:hypothetical protein